jgi:hypothetical protein
MRVLRLTLLVAALATAVVPGLAVAQTTADQMRASARQLRETVEKLGPNLPPDARAAMLQQAADLEKSAGDSAFQTAATPAREAPLSERLMAQHGRLDWIATKAACAGYTGENYQTFRFNPAINDRDSHCRNAYGHYASYLNAVRLGQDEETREKALFYYDAAARRAVALVGG